jgi:poly-gamma-glutamate synthesis protein (capsule biosynthesis protein)
MHCSSRGFLGFICTVFILCVAIMFQPASALEPNPLTEEECRTRFSSCTCTENQCIPEFEASIEKLTPSRIQKLKQGAWSTGCPIALSEIRSLNLIHLREDGRVLRGELIVAEKAVEDIKRVFARLYQMRFPIHKMQSVENYGGDDDLSMADNNTSILNCRNVKGTSKWSEHSYGLAIDINPLWNPYVRNKKVEPPKGKDFVDRTLSVPGLIRSGDPIVQFFSDIGWKWGGHWTRSKDYQHFSARGR